MTFLSVRPHVASALLGEYFTEGMVRIRGESIFLIVGYQWLSSIVGLSRVPLIIPTILWLVIVGHQNALVERSPPTVVKWHPRSNTSRRSACSVDSGDAVLRAGSSAGHVGSGLRALQFCSVLPRLVGVHRSGTGAGSLVASNANRYGSW